MDHVDGVPVVHWIAERLRWARRRGWTGEVVSGYRTHAEQARLFDEWRRGERPGPVARPGVSNHQGKRWPRGAVDVTQPRQLAELLRELPENAKPLRWFGPGDEPHFSSTGR